VPKTQRHIFCGIIYEKSFISVFNNIFLCIISKFFIGSVFYMGMLYVSKDLIFIYTLENIIKSINNRIKK